MATGTALMRSWLHLPVWAFLFVVCLPATADLLSPEQLVDKLQAGGLVVYWRHALTDHTQQDKTDVDLGNCSSQRNLSEQGRQQARVIGQAFKALNIKMGDIISSPYCRCIETAEIAFGYVRPDNNLYFAVGLKKSQRNNQSLLLQKILSNRPKEGINSLVVSHTANLKEAANIWPKPEAVMHIFQPLGHDFRHLGSIPPEFWLTVETLEAEE